MMTCPGKLFPQPPDGNTLLGTAKDDALRGLGLSVECVETVSLLSLSLLFLSLCEWVCVRAPLAPLHFISGRTSLCCRS